MLCHARWPRGLHLRPQGDLGQAIRQPIDISRYYREFPIDQTERNSLRSRALEHALDIRKFEIDLYWRRAAYFWTFIAASLAAYGGVQALKPDPALRQHLTVLIGSLGLVFSFAWYCVNRGSKQWQENWEKHVDLLEDKIIGPLYKTVIVRREIGEPVLSWKGFDVRCRRLISGPGNFSVSKVNQIVSLFVTIIWIPIIWDGLGEFGFDRSPDLFAIAIILFAALTCIGIGWFARTGSGGHEFDVWRRGQDLSRFDQDEAQEPSGKS